MCQARGARRCGGCSGAADGSCQPRCGDRVAQDTVKNADSECPTLNPASTTTHWSHEVVPIIPATSGTGLNAVAKPSGVVGIVTRAVAPVR